MTEKVSSSFAFKTCLMKNHNLCSRSPHAPSLPPRFMPCLFFSALSLLPLAFGLILVRGVGQLKRQGRLKRDLVLARI